MDLLHSSYIYSWAYEGVLAVQHQRGHGYTLILAFFGVPKDQSIIDKSIQLHLFPYSFCVIR